jgi:acetyltransferase-like isoleucine patch superfamily enzyme
MRLPKKPITWDEEALVHPIGPRKAIIKRGASIGANATILCGITVKRFISDMG